MYLPLYQLDLHSAAALNSVDYTTRVTEYLRNPQTSRNSHFVPVHAVYQRQGGGARLILPWPKCTLRELWKTSKPRDPFLDKSDILWMLEECRGMAAGLSEIDDYIIANNSAGFQYVGICPENIFLYPCSKAQLDDIRGNLAIATFVPTPFLRWSRETFTPLRHFKIADWSYRPPESYLPPETMFLEPKLPPCDVWPYGCVLLEFVTWCLGGWALLEEFRRCREPGGEFFELVRVEEEHQEEPAPIYARVKRSVYEVIPTLYSLGLHVSR